jgi:hypothetical protein
MDKPITFQHLADAIAIGTGLFFGVKLCINLEIYLAICGFFHDCPSQIIGG